MPAAPANSCNFNPHLRRPKYKTRSRPLSPCRSRNSPHRSPLTFSTLAMTSDTVTDVEPLPRATQVRLRQLDDQVIMVVHQHEGMQPQPEPRHHFSQQLAEVLPVSIVPVNGAPLIAPPGEMIPSAG